MNLSALNPIYILWLGLGTHYGQTAGIKLHITFLWEEKHFLKKSYLRSNTSNMTVSHILCALKTTKAWEAASPTINYLANRNTLLHIFHLAQHYLSRVFHDLKQPASPWPKRPSTHYYFMRLLSPWHIDCYHYSSGPPGRCKTWLWNTIWGKALDSLSGFLPLWTPPSQT